MEEIITVCDFSINNGMKLSQLATEKQGMILLFVPYPNSQTTKILLKDFNHYYHKLISLGYEIVTIMSSDPRDIDELKDELYLSFPVVNDLDGQIILDYKVTGHDPFSIYPQPLRKVIVVDSSLKIIKQDRSIVPTQYAENLVKWLSSISINDVANTAGDKELVNN